MKKLFLFVFAAALVIMGCGVCMAFCSSDEFVENAEQKVTVTRNVGYFSKVESSSIADVKFVQGKTESVKIVGSKSLVDNLVVQLHGETLVLSDKNTSLQNGNAVHIVNYLGHKIKGDDEDNPLVVYISSPDLTDVKQCGSGSFTAEGNLDTDALNVELVGSGDVDFGSVVCDRVSMVLRGSGDVSAKKLKSVAADFCLKGSGDFDVDEVSANAANILLQGSGDLEAELKGVADSKVSLLGSGDLKVGFIGCGNVDCELRGSGDVYLSGTVKTLRKRSSGSGDIHTSKLKVSQRF